MFDVDTLVADCQAARDDREPRRAIRAVLERAVADSAAMADALRPAEGGLEFLHQGPDLTVIHIVWAPRMRLYPHDHRMWAAIGIYTGREDNIFWRRRAGDPGARIEAAGAKALSERDAVPLGPDVIHSVINPVRRLTGAIHVYGGDFFAATHSQWDPERLREEPYDVKRLLALFEESNRLYASA